MENAAVAQISSASEKGTPEEDSTDQRVAAAMTRYAHLLHWYDNAKARDRIYFYTFQVAAIVLAGMTPIVILINGSPKWIQAFPAAAAAMASALVGTFHWRENFLRFANTAEALRSEKVQYDSRVGKLYGHSVDDATAFDTFVQRVEAIVSSETTEWRTTYISGASERSK
jgi:hypothetical protein